MPDEWSSKEVIDTLRLFSLCPSVEVPTGLRQLALREAEKCNDLAHAKLLLAHTKALGVLPAAAVARLHTVIAGAGGAGRGGGRGRSTQGGRGEGRGTPGGRRTRPKA
ncbi:hypothetical protein HYH03_003446 [Edaphochlamys debaryana]|uniref:Uncharacterized protein n=1 Tax=Edaphochlamys debaryana TaxID=47281 RepID=A0A835Y9X5_9CHLO|nr:hypothetical protein HYH03_003446 [Edaphochlamys debaryana]|eukprot:KAG2498706.1 hypothetical protein HYH03_003446 [Edaphochlamys debaryana]